MVNGLRPARSPFKRNGAYTWQTPDTLEGSPTGITLDSGPLVATSVLEAPSGLKANEKDE